MFLEISVSFLDNFFCKLPNHKIASSIVSFDISPILDLFIFMHNASSFSL